MDVGQGLLLPDFGRLAALAGLCILGDVGTGRGRRALANKGAITSIGQYCSTSAAC